MTPSEELDQRLGFADALRQAADQLDHYLSNPPPQGVTWEEVLQATAKRYRTEADKIDGGNPDYKARPNVRAARAPVRPQGTQLPLEEPDTSEKATGERESGSLFTDFSTADTQGPGAPSGAAPGDPETTGIEAGISGSPGRTIKLRRLALHWLSEVDLMGGKDASPEARRLYRCAFQVIEELNR